MDADEMSESHPWPVTPDNRVTPLTSYPCQQSRPWKVTPDNRVTPLTSYPCQQSRPWQVTPHNRVTPLTSYLWRQSHALDKLSLTTESCPWQVTSHNRVMPSTGYSSQQSHALDKLPLTTESHPWPVTPHNSHTLDKLFLTTESRPWHVISDERVQVVTGEGLSGPQSRYRHCREVSYICRESNPAISTELPSSDHSENYSDFGLCPSSSTLKNSREHDVSKTGSVSVLRWGERYTYCAGVP
jgi:hypothetical protein